MLIGPGILTTVNQSITAYVFVYESGEISWSTKKQKTVTLSSTEAEFISITAVI